MIVSNRHSMLRILFFVLAAIARRERAWQSAYSFSAQPLAKFR